MTLALILLGTFIVLTSGVYAILKYWPKAEPVENKNINSVKEEINFEEIKQEELFAKTFMKFEQEKGSINFRLKRDNDYEQTENTNDNDMTM